MWRWDFLTKNPKVHNSLYKVPSFYTFTRHFLEIHFNMFYVFLWVIPGRLNFICRRLGTLCSIFIGGYLSAYKDGRDRVFRNVGIFRRRGITQKKAYNIQNTANVWNQEHFNIILLSSSRFPRDFLLGILRGFSSSLRICIYHLSQFSQIGTKYELSTQTTQFFLSSHW